ncbi:2'-5' RNA ligase [Sulfuriferula sp. AH1]|uniref:RNA 2',3'-cyclic phosphodiesterase n=1 Tax=Sulfuriferula sp. AH1 TaxID=1985873 RepID=UPI000B3B77A6|nr:RNA 2',3'-cyclic phosphodiesterase [Sulfuriferula sp. AH1]ARU31116.1 2'-5' RNA ligase [Sulfuriferula sp. AH1]
MMATPGNADTAGRNTARVFFALWPDPDMRTALAGMGKHMHAQCGGRRTRAESIHITLAFVGEVGIERIAELQALAAQLQCAAFNFELARTGWWRHNHIAWVAPETVPQGLIDLASALQSRLKGAGFKVDERAYLPHVTLLRKADCPWAQAAMKPLRWTARNFVLVKSVTGENGSAYEIIGRWPLVSAL